jgi:hypothetical protein
MGQAQEAASFRSDAVVECDFTEELAAASVRAADLDTVTSLLSGEQNSMMGPADHPSAYCPGELKGD